MLFRAMSTRSLNDTTVYIPTFEQDSDDRKTKTKYRKPGIQLKQYSELTSRGTCVQDVLLLAVLSTKYYIKVYCSSTLYPTFTINILKPPFTTGQSRRTVKRDL